MSLLLLAPLLLFCLFQLGDERCMELLLKLKLALSLGEKRARQADKLAVRLAGRQASDKQFSASLAIACEKTREWWA